MATARRFAAALGIIAFVFVATFAIWHGTSLEEALLKALLGLVVFAVFGFVIGLIGAGIASDSAQSEVERKVAAEELRRGRAGEERAARDLEERESLKTSPPTDAGRASDAKGR